MVGGGGVRFTAEGVVSCADGLEAFVSERVGSGVEVWCVGVVETD